MDLSDVTKKLSDVNLSRERDINILLLGETGVGKSTFINSIANYLIFKSFKKAAKNDLQVLIPTQFTLSNKFFEQVTVQVGSCDKNEYQEFGAAATQDVKTYVFPIGEGKTRLRLIDTPGMGDPRGVEQDNLNCENILAYLGQLQELHAICFLMKPTVTRLTVLFEYCVKQILSRLEKSASHNIIFVFTNTRGTNYSAGDTQPCLQKVVAEVKAAPPHVEIPLKPANIFCFDNEAFRYLAALQQNVSFDDGIHERFVESWEKSSKESWRMIHYIVGDASNDALTPHQLKNTISINEARRIIVQLAQPLADITQLVFDNIRILERHRENLAIENQSLDELKKKLYIPVINLQVTQLTQPVTVCTSPKCADVHNVGDLRKWHYRMRCHDPCYLHNIPKEIVGDPGLINCAAMTGTICKKCTCDYRLHQHVYYMTTPVGDKIKDDVVQKNIYQKEQALNEARRLMGEIDNRKKDLENERNIIIRSSAQFAHFLQHNAITAFNDSYKAYIEYLIKREEGLGPNCDREVIRNLEYLLAQYNQMKTAFDSILANNAHLDISTTTATADGVLKTINALYQLPLNGKKIRELLKTQKLSRKAEYSDNCEYIHLKATLQDLAQKQPKKKDSSKTTDDEKKSRKPPKKPSYDRPPPAYDSIQSQRHPPRLNYNQHQPPQWDYNQHQPPQWDYNQQWNYQDQPKQNYQNPRSYDPKFSVRVEVPLHLDEDRRRPQQEPPQNPVYDYGPPPLMQHDVGPPQDYRGASANYRPPNRNYQGPRQHYNYQAPPRDYYSYQQPPQNYQGPPQSNQAPPHGYQGQPQQFHYQRHGATRQPGRGTGFRGRGSREFRRGRSHSRGHSSYDKKGGKKSGRSSSSDSSSD